MLSMLMGLKKMAQFSQAISGIEDIFEHVMGVPVAIASNIGNQNHSYREGNTKAFDHA